ncbi:MAG TPA: hypothetical protein PKX58_10795, partial [Flexilinea sp.]|nr:hypothetical protein [Flexilinea sp.]
GYKEGSVWNRPLQYFPQQQDVDNAVPMDAFSSVVTKKGRFGTDPYNIFLNNGMSLTPFPTDAFSGMVTKKGRFGTDLYSIFSTMGLQVIVKYEPAVINEFARIFHARCAYWH